MKYTKIDIKPEEEFDLKVYLLALKSKYQEIGDYEEQAKLLQIEFGLNVTGRDIWLLSEPNLEEETLDRELIWRNLK